MLSEKFKAGIIFSLEEVYTKKMKKNSKTMSLAYISKIYFEIYEIVLYNARCKIDYYIPQIIFF